MDAPRDALTTPCLEWHGQTATGGYGRARLGSERYADGSRRKVLVHRWVFEQLDGPLRPGEVVMHLCDNPPCFRFDHLRRGTPALNSADAIAKGRHAHGERNATAKLTATQVSEIRAAYAAGGVTMMDLARRYDVRDSTISRIITGEHWKEVA